MSSDLNAGGKPPWFRLSWLAAGRIYAGTIAVVFAIAGVALLARQFLAARDPRTVIVDAAARAPHRALEARLAGDFTFKPYRSNAPVYLAATDIPYAYEKGLALLLSLNVDPAIAAFESLLPKDVRGVDYDHATDAELLTNLAAALLERSRLHNSPRDLAPALAASSRAIKLSPTLAAPRHVYASVVEALSLREDALEAWNAYLATDPSSAWSAEVRRRITALRRQLRTVSDAHLSEAFARSDADALAEMAAAEPQLVRTTAEDDFLGQWGRAVESSDTARAATLLRNLRIVADELQHTGSDRTLSDCIEHIKRAQTGEVRKIAAAHRMYGEARKVFAAARDERARRALLRAHGVLARVDSPLQWRALVFVAAVLQTEGNHDQALEATARVVHDLESRNGGSPVAIGQALWVKGQVEFARGLPHAALQSFIEARRHFATTAEASNIGGLETWIASCYRYLGNTESAWAHYVRALQLLQPNASYDRRQVALSDAAHSATLSNDHALAQLLARRIGRSAIARKDAIYEAQALHLEGLVESGRGRWREAENLLGKAEAILDRQAETPATIRQSAFVAAARVEALGHFDPDAAVRLSRTAIERFREQQYHARLLRLHLDRGYAHAKLGQNVAAEDAYRDGLAEVARQRTSLRMDEERSTFTDTARALYDALIAALLERGDSDSALEIVRSARTIGLTSPGSLFGSGGDDFHGSAARGTTLIEYYVLPDALLTWSTARGVRRFAGRPIPISRLQADVERHVAAIQQCEEPIACIGDASLLFDLLVQPMTAALQDANDLVIAPDGLLHRVPFAALYDPKTRRFVVERHAVTIALGNEPTPGDLPHRAILVAAPDAADPNLPRLVMAKTEARRAAALFARATLLEADDATADRMLAEASKHDVIHYAGHGAWNERQPRFAALLMAAVGNRPTGSLYAYEVESRRFDQTNLVVLAACDSARGRVSGVGLLGIARAFTAAGVPRVVGSLWPVDDTYSARLFGRFYPALSRGTSAAHALRMAQQEMLAASHGPAAWAAYQIYSGNDRQRRESRH